jgi:hypothetical protein
MVRIYEVGDRVKERWSGKIMFVTGYSPIKNEEIDIVKCESYISGETRTEFYFENEIEYVLKLI